MKLRTYPLFAVMALLCAACVNDTDTVDAGNFPSDAKVRISTELEAIQTKAGPYTGSNLSLSIDYGMDSPYTATNIKWSTADNGTSWTPENQMLWKDAISAAKVYAYAPAIAGVTDIENVPFTVASDQSASLIPSDLLTYKDEAFIPGSSLTTKKSLNIALKHTLAKLVVNLTYDDLWGDNRPAINDVTIIGTKPTTSLNVRTGAVSTASGEMLVIKPRKTDTNIGMVATFEAVIIPQTLNPGAELISIKLDNGGTALYVIATTKGVTFEAGKQHIINVEIAKHPIRLSAITKSKWDTI